jgi:hypothetical protein
MIVLLLKSFRDLEFNTRDAHQRKDVEYNHTGEAEQIPRKSGLEAEVSFVDHRNQTQIRRTFRVVDLRIVSSLQIVQTYHIPQIS